MTAARENSDLHELVDLLSPAQADVVRAVVLQLITPGGRPVTESGPTRRRLSFAGTLAAETDLAERAEAILDEIVTRNAG